MQAKKLGGWWLVVAVGLGRSLLADETRPDSYAWDNLTPLLTSIVRDHLPHEFVDERRWGQQTQILDGLKLHREGLEIKTKRRWKSVNHGTWKKYRATLVDPEHSFQVRIENPRLGEKGRMVFDLIADARLLLTGRLSQWQTGVQLVSLSLDAEAAVRLRLTCETGLRIDPTRLPPDVIFDPVVTSADLDLVEFRLRRLSQIHGRLAEELGRGLREVIDDKLDDNRTKIVERMNRQLERSRGKLRLSVADWLEKATGNETRDK